MNKKIIIFLVLLVLSLAVSGCSDKEENTITIEGENGEDVDITYTEGDSSNEDCPTGTTLTTANPSTGELVTMRIVGTEVIEGIEMCHAVYEVDTVGEDGIAKVDIYTSVNDDDESYIWTSYDEDGNVVSEMKMINNKMTVTDEDGNIVMQMDIPEE